MINIQLKWPEHKTSRKVIFVREFNANRSGEYLGGVSEDNDGQFLAVAYPETDHEQCESKPSFDEALGWLIMHLMPDRT